MLRAYVSHRQTDWDQYLAPLEFAYNNSTQASTGMSPFFLDTGQHPRVPLSLVDMDVDIPAVDEFTATFTDSMAAARENLLAAQRRQTTQADKHRRHLEFSEGDQVLLSNQNLNMAGAGPSRKLRRKYEGPFIVERVISPVAYQLRLPAYMRIHPVFHVSLLKPYRENPERFEGRRQQPPPPPIATDDLGEWYEVERVLAKRRFGRTTKYLVKWKGYPDYENSWEPARNITDTAIREYEGRDEGVAS
jgi:hypothetical protein